MHLNHFASWLLSARRRRKESAKRNLDLYETMREPVLAVLALYYGQRATKIVINAMTTHRKRVGGE